MKNLLLLFFLLSIIFNFKITQPDSKEYIEFIDAGSSAKYEPPIFISKQKLNIKLVEPDSGIFKAIKERHPELTKEEFMNLRYDRLVTDKNTYSVLLSFMTTHNEFYSRYPYNLYPEGDIDIIANGKKYNLCYKTQKGFLQN